MQREDLINGYFEGQLSAQEQLEFEALLKNDADFEKEVTFRKNLKKAIALQQRESLKTKLQSFENSATETSQRENYWLIAVVFLLFFGGLAFYQLSQNSTDDLFMTYYQTFPNTVAPTVRGQQENDLKSKAFYAYDAGNYKEASSLFTKIYATGNEDYALFYKSLSLMELQKYEESISALDNFNSTKDSNFLPYVKWYKALAHLKLKQKNEAIGLLKELTTSRNPQQEMAKKLLLELE